MKILKINENYKVNIEHIYLLEKRTNMQAINEWKESYNFYLDLYTNEPPEFTHENKILKIKFNEKNDPELVKIYQEKLNEYIISIIGQCPKYEETYHLLLASGLKIQIGKYLYDKLNEILNKYVVEL